MGGSSEGSGGIREGNWGNWDGIWEDFGGIRDRICEDLGGLGLSEWGNGGVRGAWGDLRGLG